MLEDGRKVTVELVRELVRRELDRVRSERGDERFEGGHFRTATRLFEDLVISEELEEFLTLKAYQLLD